MRIYQDIFTDAEIISDSYPWVSLFDGAVVEVQSRMVVVGDVNVDVGCGNAFGGKNEDDEEEGGAGGAPVEKVNDLIDAFGYSETSFEKDEWIKAFKAYAKRLLDHKKAKEEKEEDINKFKADAAAYVKYISGKWADLTAYTPKEDYAAETATIFSYWKNEEDEAPVFIFFMGGLKSYKV